MHIFLQSIVVCVQSLFYKIKIGGAAIFVFVQYYFYINFYSSTQIPVVYNNN